MALSAVQKQKILLHLGWPSKSLISDSTHYSSQCVSRLTNLTADIESETQSMLTKIDSLDTKLEAASCRLSASKVDDIELNPREIEMLRAEKRRIVKMLSEYLDLPILSNNGKSINILV